jgi:hypothetical protein
VFSSSEQERRGEERERRNNKSEEKGGRGKGETCYNNHDTASSTRSFINFDTLFISFHLYRIASSLFYSTLLYISQATNYTLPSST